MEHWEKLLPYLLPFLFIAVVTTPLVYLVTAWTIQLLIRRKGGKGPVRDILFPPFFGIVLTCAAWSVAQWIQKRTGCFLLNPLL